MHAGTEHGAGGPPHREYSSHRAPRPHHFLARFIAFAPLLLSCGGVASLGQSPSDGPRTRAELTNFQETSTHADVMAFIDSLSKLDPAMTVGEIGKTSEGRSIPYIIAARPPVSTPREAQASGRPVVYVQANIHAGEVEGKEALQAVVRDLLLENRRNVLDSIILIAVPIYNGDGNERFDKQERNRGAQQGPAMIGQRPNAQGFDLNRDYMKVDAPETRASLAMFAQWNPHVFVDLHTTNGSYHGYALTWAPSLNPAAEIPGLTFGGAYARDSILPEVQRNVQQRHGFAIFPYGNFNQNQTPGSPPPQSWVTYDHRPRFGTNYFALRGRIAVLSEAYSHDPFERRVKSTYAFTRELLSSVAARRDAIISLTGAAERALSGAPATVSSVQIPVRARLTTNPRQGPVRYEILVAETDSVTHEIGVPRALRRSGEYVTRTMPIVDRFDGMRPRPMPWGYAIRMDDSSAIRVLAAHGVRMQRLNAAWSTVQGEQFEADTAIISTRLFQGHNEALIEGSWRSQNTDLPSGTVIIPTAQPLGVVVMYLLEPESDDGVVAWNLGLRAGRGLRHGITRLIGPPPVATSPFTAQ